MGNVLPNRGRNLVEVRARDGAKWLFNYHGQRRAISRQYLFDLCGRISPTISVDSDGIRYFLSTSDKEISRKVFMWGNFEQEKIALTVRLVEERTGESVGGKEWIDMGANIGTTTVPAVKLFGAGHVWAFEPVPQNVDLLRCNIVANKIGDRVTVVPVALSNVDGPAEMELSPDSWGDHRIVMDSTHGSMGEASRSRIDIHTVRFDQVAVEEGIVMKRVGLVWIDTQGHEGSILQGASDILKSTVPVLAEYWPYGLRRSSCLAMFHEVVIENYTVVLDLGSRSGPVEYRAEDVEKLERKYGGLSFTDLLLL